MKINYPFTLALLCFAIVCTGQNSIFDVNFEFQAYPTGLIPGLRLEKGFNEKNAASIRLGYQLIDHRDLGKHDDETGTGYGFTLGYKRFLKEGFRGLHLGVRNDVWSNKINWEHNKFAPIEPTSGTTKIIVLQPTLEAGWTFIPAKKCIITPTLAFGYEINVKTEGEPTGEGVILLAGLNLGYRFYQ